MKASVFISTVIDLLVKIFESSSNLEIAMIQTFMSKVSKFNVCILPFYSSFYWRSLHKKAAFFNEKALNRKEISSFTRRIEFVSTQNYINKSDFIIVSK